MKSIDLFFAQPWLLLLPFRPRRLCCWRRACCVGKGKRAGRIARRRFCARRPCAAGGHRRGAGGTRYLTERQTVVLLDQSASMEPVRAQADAWAEEAKRTSTRRFCRLPRWMKRAQSLPDGTDIAAAIDEAASRFAGRAQKDHPDFGRRADAGRRGLRQRPRHRRAFGSTRCR